MPSFIFNGKPEQDTNMYYNGAVLPRDAVKPVNTSIDFTNNPSLITIGNGDNAITLPSNTLVYIDGGKIIPKAQIIDGIEIFQHVARKSREINFEMDIWDTNENGKQIFPQKLVNDLYTYVINPNSVINVVNTLLNNIGISQLIIDDHNLQTVRGSFKVPLRLKCYENIPGNYLIVG